MHDFMKKATLILCGLAMVIGSSLLAPAMQKISLEYPTASPTILPLLITLPALTLLAGLVLSSALTNRFPIKTLILSGIILILIGGVLPYFLHSLTIIIILRGVMGVGLGMIMPLQTALFAEYEEAQRTVLIGGNVTVNCVLGVIFFALAGKLAETNWRLIFLLYAFFVVIFILALIYIPNRAPADAAASTAAARRAAPRRHMPANVFVYCFLIALVTLCVYVMTTIMANFLAFYNLGSASTVGLLTAMTTAISAIGGMLVPLITKYLRNYAAPILVLMCAIGFFCYTVTSSLGIIAVGMAIIGFAQGVLNCILTFKLTQVVPLEQVSAASSCYLATLFVCQFLSPYWLMLHKSMLHLSGDAAAFGVYAVVMAVLAAFAFYWMRREDHTASSSR